MIGVRMAMETNFSAHQQKALSEERVKLACKGTAREFQRLADPYVPFLTGEMDKSSFRSPFDKGEVVYDTPYARHVYYLDNSATNWTRDKHPNAMSHWGEFVKSKYKDHLKSTFEKFYFGGS